MCVCRRGASETFKKMRQNEATSADWIFTPYEGKYWTVNYMSHAVGEHNKLILSLRELLRKENSILIKYYREAIWKFLKSCKEHT